MGRCFLVVTVWRRQIKLWIVLGICLFMLTCCGKSPHSRYRIAVDPSWFPLELQGKEAHVFAFTNELLTEIATLEGIKIKRIDMNWDNLTLGLQSEKYDAMISSMQPYVFNQEKYQFSDMYLSTGAVIVMRKRDQFLSMASLTGREVAVSTALDEMLLLTKNPKVIIRNYTMIPTALNEIVLGTLDAMLAGSIPVMDYVQDLYGNELKIVTEALNDHVGLRMITLKDQNTELIEKFNRGLEKMKSNGSYEKLAKKWRLLL